ncbi:hypothetical protein [Nonomuraea indica]|uniref:hypothetical protein n=1 Tax=Nonomuraea indica TaxID=1581193 RepID=UPI000C79F0FA|nr:hypothetical protein [Nonomuraea indica]
MTPEQPAPTVTVTVPVPIATPQITMTVQQPPPDTPHPIEVIDGLGSMGAALVATLGLIIALITAKGDRKEASQRLQDERAAADRRLQAQLQEQRDRDRREFLIEQLMKVGDIYAQKLWATSTSQPDLIAKSKRLLEIHLPSIPGRYASLLKLESSVAFYEEARAEAQRRLGPGDPEFNRMNLFAFSIAEELAENIEELVREESVLDTEPVDNP